MRPVQTIKRYFLSLAVFGVLALAPVRPAYAYTAVIDIPGLAVIKDTMQMVNQQLQQLQELTNIQDEILDSIGTATGIDSNSILFQGLMELACGKFELPRIVLPGFPIPNIRLPDLPDSLCDWFGYGDNYQSNLWARVFATIETSEEYTKAAFFIDSAGQQFQDAVAQAGGNVYCALWDMRAGAVGGMQNAANNASPNGAQTRPSPVTGPCPERYRNNPPQWRQGQPLPVPVEVQLAIRQDRTLARQQARITATSVAMNTLATASKAGATVQNLTDGCNKAETLQDKLSCQNNILLTMLTYQLEQIKLQSYQLDLPAKEGIVDEDIVMGAGTAQP